MKQQYIHYPTFSAGEVLTKSLLEELANYSDEQACITRSQLIGFGIVNGLEYSYSNGMITIKPGVAVTAAGHAICIDEEVKYNFMEDLNDGSFKLVPSKTDKAVRLSKKPNQVLALKYERVEENAYTCSQDSCDMTHMRTHIMFTPMLLPVAEVEKTCVQYYAPSSPVALHRFNDVAGSLVTNYLHDNVRECFNKNCGIIIEKFKVIEAQLGDKLSSLGFLFSDMSPYSLRTEFVNALARLVKLHKMSLTLSTGSAKEKKDSASPEIPVYFLHFLEDVEEAYNEYIQIINNFLAKYNNRLYHTDAMIDTDSIMLGKLTDANSDNYRNHFMPAQVFSSYEDEKALVRSALYRLAYLVNMFIGTSLKWYKLAPTIVSVNPHAPLAQKPIPFYYKNDSRLNSVWTLSPIAPSIVSTITLCSDANNLKTCAFHSPSDCYEVGGYYNQKLEKVMKAFRDTIKEHDLQLEVKDVAMIEIYSTMLKRLKTECFKFMDIDNLKEEAPDLARLIRFKERMETIASRRQDVKAKVTKKDKLSTFRSMRRLDPKAVAAQLVKLGRFKTVDEALTSADLDVLKKLQEIANLCLAPEYQNADHRYLPRKTVLYVAHYRNRVIFCFSA